MNAFVLIALVAVGSASANEAKPVAKDAAASAPSRAPQSIDEQLTLLEQQAERDGSVVTDREIEDPILNAGSHAEN